MFCVNPDLSLTTTLPTTVSGRKKRTPHFAQRRDTALDRRQISKREAVETEEEIAMRSYGSVLRYQCGQARRFYDPDLALEYDERNMTCNWNKTWTVRDYIDDCVWVACLYPPEPPEGTFLSLLWSGDPVEFYGNVSYTCQEDGLYFEWDRDMTEYNISCQPGGTWDQPTEWPICVPCKLEMRKSLN